MFLKSNSNLLTKHCGRGIKFLVCNLLLALFCSPVSVWSADTLVVGYIERAPVIFQNADGALRGSMGTELAKLMEKARIHASYKRFLPKQIDQYMSDESVQAQLATPVLADDKSVFLFSEKPIVQLQFYTYRLKAAPPVVQFEDIFNKNIIMPVSIETMRGEPRRMFTEPEHNITILAENYRLEQALPLLRNLRADYYVSYVAPSSVAFDFNQSRMLRYLQADKLFSVPLHLVVRKSTPNASDIMARINNASEKR